MKKPIITILLYASCLQLFAQQAPDTTNKIIEFKEAVISVNKVEEKRKEVVQQFSTINAKQIKTLNAQNTAELIMLTGNLNVQTSQQCGGSPAIRGFEASRILLTLDNVRMNNLIYRSGHLQNILTFDQNVFERVDILYGPSSTVYGSDALGGVIHMHTRNPQLSNDKLLLNGNAYARYGSINNEKTGHLDLNIAGKRFGSLTSVTYSDMGDQKSGRNKLFQDSVFGMRPYYIDRIEGKDSIVANNDKWMQKFSGYNQVDVLQKFLFKQNKHLTHVVNLQYSTSSDIPRYDRLTELSGNGDLAFAEWYYGPQTRLLAAYEMH
ncbi:MAG TPA: TonB-dependent receptor plug domain-containing protein [Bacteroidia bacterium]|nr:TonB-dependent receptor plug domain-containing protein [Bacteroidia bacterium]